MNFVFRAVWSALTAVVVTVMELPANVLKAVRLAYRAYVRKEVLLALMQTNWEEETDKSALLVSILNAPHIELFDWDYGWRAAHVYVAGRPGAIVIQLVEGVYRARDLTKQYEITVYNTEAA
jgi:hypothetical protein